MRNGKIATLPCDLREELNQRLENHEDGPALLAWLNALPEVQTHLQENFDGLPVTKQNLSQWRLGGFREWQLRRDLEDHAHELAGAARDLGENLDLQALPGHLAASLATRYAALLNTWGGEPDPDLAEKLRLLHALTRDVALLQKTLHQSAQQERQRHQQMEDDRQSGFAADRKKILNPIWAARQEAALGGLFGGGKLGEHLAKVVAAVNYDLPLPKPGPALQAELEAELEAESSQPSPKPPTPNPKDNPSPGETTPAKTRENAGVSDDGGPALHSASRRRVKPSQSTDPAMTAAPEPISDKAVAAQTPTNPATAP